MKLKQKKDLVKNNINIFKFLVYLFLLVLICLILMLVFFVWRYLTFEYKYSPKYSFKQLNNIDKSYLFIKLTDIDLKKAYVTEMCGFIVEENGLNVDYFCVNGDQLLQDKSQFSLNEYLSLKNLAIQTNMIANTDLGMFVKFHIDEIMGYSFSKLFIYSDSCITTNNDVLKKDLSISDFMKSYFTISSRNLVLNEKFFTSFNSCVYSNFDTQDVKTLRSVMYKNNLNLHKLNTEIGRNVEDNKTFEYISYSSWDYIFRSIFKNTSIINERVQVEIYNATNLDGVASTFSRWLSNKGIDVIRIDNAPSHVGESCEKTKIYIPSGVSKFPLTFNIVNSVLMQYGYEDVEILSNRPDFITSGDIILLVCDKKN